MVLPFVVVVFVAVRGPQRWTQMAHQEVVCMASDPIHHLPGRATSEVLAGHIHSDEEEEEEEGMHY